MDRKQAIEFINRQTPDYLQKAKKTGYVCPVCGNGSGKDGTGITKRTATATLCTRIINALTGRAGCMQIT